MAAEFEQLIAECIGVAANFLWVFPIAFVFFKILDMIWGNRVSAKDEITGLDITEMGVPGYVIEDPIEVKRAGQDHLTHSRPGRSPQGHSHHLFRVGKGPRFLLVTAKQTSRSQARPLIAAGPFFGSRLASGHD